MKKLHVWVEVNGSSQYVGRIEGDHSEDACFSYADSYVNDPQSRGISISLPLEQRTFDARSTRNFFEGLLPEGFTRRCVAEWIHTDENDYLTILERLGEECLGAIKITADTQKKIEPKYKKLTDGEVQKLAREGAMESAELVTKSHLSLTGASGKVGLYYDAKEGAWYLPVGEAPSTHIVKQSHVRLRQIVANEQLCLLTAKKLGIEIPESFIIHPGTPQEESALFATRRYDRKIDEGNKRLNDLILPKRLHQEDFAQALGIAATDKYEKDHGGYAKKLFEMLRNYSSDPIADQIKLWDICVYNYLVGNTDNHIKNLSLLYSENLNTVRLAPAYDIVSTMVYESSTENMALSIGGFYNIHDITREAFAVEAEQDGLGTKMFMNRFDQMVDGFEKALEDTEKELTAQGFQEVRWIREKILQEGGISLHN